MEQTVSRGFEKRKRGTKRMIVKAKYMLWLAGKAGVKEEHFEVHEENITLGEFLKIISKRRPGIASYVDAILSDRGEIIVLINGQTPQNGIETKLRNGDEVVLIPPVSGG